MFEGRKYGGGVIYEPTLVLREERVWLGDGSRIDSFCKVEGGLGVHIRDGVHIASFSHINLGGGITIIENGVGISSGVRIVSGSNIPALGRSSSACDPSNVSERKMTTLRENCIIFANAVVLPGVTIGRNSVVAAGAVVTKDVPDGQVWAGVPARFVGNVRLPDGRRPDATDYAEYMRQIELFQ